MLALWFLGPQLEHGARAGPVPGALPALRTGRLDVVYWLAAAQRLDHRRLGRDLRPDGRAAGRRAQGRRRHRSRSWPGSASTSLITVVGRGFISWQGHLGGFLGGLLIAAILVYSPRQHRTIWQSVGLVALAVGLVAAVLARTAALT